MDKDFKIDSLFCAFSEEKHFFEKPLTLSCGHSVCQKCVPIDYKSVKCKKCGELNNYDLKSAKESLAAKSLLALNFNELFDDLGSRYNESVTYLTENINNLYGTVQIEAKYAIDEVEIRIESLKIELDEIKETLINQINGSEQKLKEQLNSFNIGVHEENLKSLKSVIRNRKFNLEIHQNYLQSIKKDTNSNISDENSLYRFQAHLKEANKLVEKLKNMNYHLSFEYISENKLLNDIVGNVNCNFYGLKGRIMLGDYKTFDLKTDPSDLCFLPNGNLLFANYLTTKNLSLYDENFSFIKNVAKIHDQDILPYSLVTNNKDSIYINSLNKIIMTDLDLNYLKEYENKLECPSYMMFHNELLYVCETNKKRLLVLDSDLAIRSKIYLSIKPIKIEILNNLAYIGTSYEDKFFYFYDLNDFKIKYKYNRCSNAIVHQNSFFCLGKGLTINIFDKNGLLEDQVKLSEISNINITQSRFMKINKNKLFVHEHEKKILIF